MKILYGVCGEGFGHSSRALTLGNYLEKKGHRIIFITYGQAYKVLRKKFKCIKVKGLELIFEKSVLKKGKTIKYNLDNFPKNLKNLKKFHKLMLDFDPDVCISDMEPIVPILRYWYKKLLICFDNQHRLTNLKINIPKKDYQDYLIAREVTNNFVRRADYFIITSFSKEKIKTKNTYLISPIIRDSVKKIKPKEGKKILVYLTKKDKKIIKILKNFDENFVVYGYNKNKKIKNLKFRTRDYFLKDLANCKAVIATAGFTLMSEAIYLKKPYFALPLKGQFEQTLNALFLKRADFGDYADELEEKDISHFLYNLEKYKHNLKNNKNNKGDLFNIFNKVLTKIKKDGEKINEKTEK